MKYTLLSFWVVLALFLPWDSERTLGNCPINGGDTLSYTKLGQIVGKQIIIDHDVDLEGKTCKLPKGFLLRIQKGKIKNGILLGNQTKLSCKSTAFENISIKGAWNVPQISTDLFSDLGKENSLKNVFALANPDVKNTIIIESGEYLVKASKDADICLYLPGNTDLYLNGIISLTPNNFKSYYILQATGKNISINGKGIIKGDRHSHIGSEGEWGMGVNLKGAKNVTIENLTIRECWGDCIYIGGHSKNVKIENCNLDDSRRQGVSITNADGVTIRNCLISNIHGTNPQYGIDLEPNEGNAVDHVNIENVKIINCEGGIRATVGKKGIGNARIGYVRISNCQTSANNRYPIHLNRCDKVIVDGNEVKVLNDKSAIYSADVDTLKIQNNTIFVESRVFLSLKNTAKEALGRNGFKPIHVKRSQKKQITSNTIIER